MKEPDCYGPGSDGLKEAKEGDVLFVRSTVNSYSSLAVAYQRSFLRKVARVTKTRVITDQGERFSRARGWMEGCKYFANIATEAQVKKCEEKETWKLKRDYRKWSGGFDPDEEQIEVYVSTSLKKGLNADWARGVLREMMWECLYSCRKAKGQLTSEGLAKLRCRNSAGNCVAVTVDHVRSYEVLRDGVVVVGFHRDSDWNGSAVRWAARRSSVDRWFVDETRRGALEYMKEAT